MSAFPFSPDCGLCVNGAPHGLPSHLKSIGMTIRLRRMEGAPTCTHHRPPASAMRIELTRHEARLDEITEQLEILEACPCQYDDAGTHTLFIRWLRQQQEELNNRIALLKLELEAQR